MTSGIANSVSEISSQLSEILSGELMRMNVLYSEPGGGNNFLDMNQMS
jgi:hypothetical protein